MDSLEETERASAAIAKAPRISLATLEASIREKYFVMGDVAVALGEGVGGQRPEGYVDPLKIMTVCVLVLRNGFVVVGKAAPMSPENFNVELGRKFAYEDAIRQMWPLAAYAAKNAAYQAAE